jgi:hypothetical protein
MGSSKPEKTENDPRFMGKAILVQFTHTYAGENKILKVVFVSPELLFFNIL